VLKHPLLQWLPVFSNLAPPDIRRLENAALRSEHLKILIVDSNFEINISKKNARKLNNATSNLPSPGLQQIIINTPVLNTSNIAFNYNNFVPMDITPPDMVIIIDDSMVTDNFNKSNIQNFQYLKFLPPVKSSLQNNQQIFPSDYYGLIIILI